MRLFSKLFALGIAAAPLLLTIGCERSASLSSPEIAALAAAAERSGSPGDFSKAIAAAHAADEWQTALHLAEAAEQRLPDMSAGLRGLAVLAYARAGRLADAGRAADRIDAETRDSTAVEALLQVALASRGPDAAAELAERLDSIGAERPRGWLAIAEQMLHAGRPEAAGEALGRGQRRTRGVAGRRLRADADKLAGLSRWIEELGDRPANVVERFGTAPLPLDMTVRVPSVIAHINGEGPFRLLLDTGAGEAVLLGTRVAERLELDTRGMGHVVGVGGLSRMDGGLLDRLEIGSVICRNVPIMLDEEGANPLLKARDGVLGTGVFASARITMDFERAELRVSPSSEEPAVGQAINVWQIGAHLFAPVRLADRDATAMLDSGAAVGCLSPRWLRQGDPDHEPVKTPLPLYGMGPDLARAQVARAGELLFAGRRFADFSGVSIAALDDQLSPMMGVQIDLLIGMTTFGGMKSWTIDFPRRTIWCEWLEMDEP
jgi:hypothetical protein